MVRPAVVGRGGECKVLLVVCAAAPGGGTGGERRLPEVRESPRQDGKGDGVFANFVTRKISRQVARIAG